MNRFCSECGHKIGGDQAFCPECGTPQQPVKTVENPQKVQQPQSSPPKKQMSLRKKISFALVAILAAGSIAGHQIIKANTSPQQKVDEFLAALYAGDTDDALAELVIPETAKGDEETYLKFLAEQDLDGFKYRMYEAAAGVAEDGISRIIFHENGTHLFRIKESKFIAVYSGIQIEAIPAEVTLSSDLEGAMLTLGDTSFDTVNGDMELGSYLPGNYNCEVSMENGKVVQALAWDCRISGQEDVVLDIAFSDLTVEIWSNHTDATVFINGESTGKTLEEMDVIGLIDSDKTIELFVERKNAKGETERSEEIITSGGRFVELPILSSDNNSEVAESASADEEEETVADFNEEDLESFIADFRAAYEIALNNKDFSYIDGFLKDGSSAREELVEFIIDIGDDFYLYEFLLDEATGFKIYDETAYVSTYEEFDFTNHLHVVTNYTRSKEYEVHADENGVFQIAKINIKDTVRDN